MSTNTIENICIVGPGAMSAGIALAFAVKGYNVDLWGRKDSSLADGAARIEKALSQYEQHGITSPADRAQILARIHPTTSLETAAAKADIVIESIAEDIGPKQDIFARLDKICAPHTIFGTNTSSLSPSIIAEAVSDERKPRFVAVHLFNPAHLMIPVEIVAAKNTSQQTMDAACDLMQAIGKEPIRLAGELNGYIVNRVQAAWWHSAYTLLENGTASAREIDSAVKKNMGHSFSVMTVSEHAENLTGPEKHIVHPIYHAMREAAHEILAKGYATSKDIENAVLLTLGLRMKDTGPLESADITGLHVVIPILASIYPWRPIPVPLVQAFNAGKHGVHKGEGIHIWTSETASETISRRIATLVHHHKTRETPPARPAAAAEAAPLAGLDAA